MSRKRVKTKRRKQVVSKQRISVSNISLRRAGVESTGNLFIELKWCKCGTTWLKGAPGPGRLRPNSMPEGYLLCPNNCNKTSESEIGKEVI